MRLKTKIVVALVLMLSAVHPLPVSAAGNDYPSYLRNAWQDSETDPWGFLNRECTSFAAWRVSRTDGFKGFNATLRGSKATVWLGDAGNWGYAAARAGYAVNTTPAAGAVLWEPASYGDPWGHVAFVSHINTVPRAVKEPVKNYYYKQVGSYNGTAIFGQFYTVTYKTVIQQVPVSVTIEEYNHAWTGTYGTRVFPLTGYHYIHFKDL